MRAVQAAQEAGLDNINLDLMYALPGQSLHTAESYKEMFQSVMRMRRNCADYMRVRYAYCHSRGVEMWHSMRMNDVHWTSPGLEERPQHGDFWREHKERLARAQEAREGCERHAHHGLEEGERVVLVGEVLFRLLQPLQDFAAHRDELIVSTKAGYRMWPGPYGEWGSRKYLLASLDQSLRRMGRAC